MRPAKVRILPPQPPTPTTFSPKVFRFSQEVKNRCLFDLPVEKLIRTHEFRRVYFMSKVGILGTRALMEGNLYGEILSERGIEVLTPNIDQREKINSFIYDELIHGKFERSTKDYFRRVVSDLAQQGCDGVVMGCTEIPLILDPQDVEVPLLDSTRLLAKAALHEALREH